MEGSIERLVLGLVTILLGLGVYFITKKIVMKKLKIVKKSKTKTHKKHVTILNLILNVTKIFLAIIVALSLLQLFGIDIKTILASLSVVGVVIGLAIQDILKDIFSGVTIVFDELYVVGDIVEIQTFKGEVTAIKLRTTRIKSWSGEVKIIHNRTITDLVNYTVSNSMAVVDILIDYEDDLKAIEKDLTKLCTKLSKTLENLKSDVEVWGIEALGDSYMTFRIAAETVPECHYGIRRAIRKEVNLLMKEKGYRMPHTKIEVNNGRE